MPLRLVANRNFLLLWAAYFIAAVGDNLNDLGQLKMLDALETEESTRLMALMMFGLFLPYVVLGPLAGWCADRFSRKWTMIIADVLRAAIVVNFVVLIPRFQTWGFGPYTVMCTQMMLGMLAAFFSPARQAIMPTLVRYDQLVRANALVSALAPIGAMLGFLLGGYLVDWCGPAWNFRINSVTYACSALLILSILSPRHRPSEAAVQPTGMFGPLLEGFAYARDHRRVWQMMVLGALFWGAAGAVYSCVPALVKEVVSNSYVDVGHYRAIPAVGMVIGAVLMTIVGPRMGVAPAVLGGLALGAIGLTLLSLVFVLELGAVAAAACLGLVGLGGALLLVTIMATLQRLVPDSRRGRVFGVSDMATMGAMVLATGALGLNPIKNLDRYVPIILGLTAAAFAVTLLAAARIYRRGALTRRGAALSQAPTHGQ